MATAGNSLRQTHTLVSYDLRPSPRSAQEIDVKGYIEHLTDCLRDAKNNLKDYKRLIETYRSEILGMQRALETLNNDNLKQIVPVV